MLIDTSSTVLSEVFLNRMSTIVFAVLPYFFSHRLAVITQADWLSALGFGSSGQQTVSDSVGVLLRALESFHIPGNTLRNVT